MAQRTVTDTGLEAKLRVERSAAFTLDIDLEIPPGRTVALLGPNGAGKSTAVAAVAGLLAVDEGRIVLDGRVLDDAEAGVFVPPEERGIGVVFQDYLLFPHLTVRDNVAFGLRSRGVARAEAAERTDRWLEGSGLGHLAGKKPGELSGGEAQRVAVGRALVTEPRLLLLDEPLSALDVTTRARLRRSLLDHLDAFSGPRIVITHDPTEAFLLADEINVMEQGRITQVGTADDIRLRPRTPYIADLAGANLLTGVASNGNVHVDGQGLTIADLGIEGKVLVTIQPRAIALHTAEPSGSPRNTWLTSVELVEILGDRARLLVGLPLPLTVEITRSALDELDLHSGSPAWVSIKATEIGVQPYT